VAELKVRNLDERVISALKERARRRGVSLEEEVRSMLVGAVARRRSAFARRAAAIRASIGSPPADPDLDSVKIIRAERDSWG
jgi:plasmid stability protein